MENHLDINSQFIPYNLALKLKELGFNEKCFGWWSYINGTAACFCEYHCTNSLLIELNSSDRNCTAPLWQQAFDWLWNKTNKYIIPIPNDDKKWLCLGTKFDKYEEARLACLEKLIELCKKN